MRRYKKNHNINRVSQCAGTSGDISRIKPSTTRCHHRDDARQAHTILAVDSKERKARTSEPTELSTSASKVAEVTSSVLADARSPGLCPHGMRTAGRSAATDGGRNAERDNGDADAAKEENITAGAAVTKHASESGIVRCGDSTDYSINTGDRAADAVGRSGGTETEDVGKASALIVLTNQQMSCARD
jgi:hypothetical protein